MTDELVAYSLSKHPAPHRAKVGLGAILYGLFAPPIVWSGHLMVNFGIVSHFCFPGETPVGSVGYPWQFWLVLGLDVLALALIISGGAVSLRNWKLTGPPESHHHHLMEVGEGRTRFIAICGMAFSVFFAAVTVTDTVALAFMPLCLY